MNWNIATSCVIICSSTLIGIEIAKKYVRRTNELRELQGALSRLETEILYYTTTLPEAMCAIGETIKGTTGRLFADTGRKLKNKSNITVSEAWNESLSQLNDNFYLNEEELAILRRFGDQLGSSDKESQAKYIRLTLLQLQQQETKAQEARNRYERMYKSLGLLGGIAIAIILL